MKKCASKEEAERVFQEGLVGIARLEAAQLAARGHPIPVELRSLLDNIMASAPSDSSSANDAATVPAVAAPERQPFGLSSSMEVDDIPKAPTVPSAHVPLRLYSGYNATGAPPPAQSIPGFPQTSSPLHPPYGEANIQLVGPLLQAAISAAARAGPNAEGIRVEPEDLPEPLRSEYADRLRDVASHIPPSSLLSAEESTVTTPPSTLSTSFSGFTNTSPTPTLGSLPDTDGNDSDAVPAVFFGPFDADFGDGVDEEWVIANSVVLPDPTSVRGHVDVSATVPDVRGRGREPYDIQLSLPRDYMDLGKQVRVRVKIDVRRFHPTFSGNADFHFIRLIPSVER